MRKNILNAAKNAETLPALYYQITAIPLRDA